MAATRLRKRSPRHAYEVRVKIGDVWTWRGTRTHDRTAALAWLREHERRAADPTYAAEAAATTADAVEAYAQSRVARGRSAGTLHHVRVKSGHLLRLLPAMLRDVTHRVMERYIATRTAEGAAQTTVKKELRVAGAVLKLAARNGHLHRDPGAIIPELADPYQPRRRACTRDELHRLVNALPIDRAAHVAWIVATGSRWSESLRAHGRDVRRGEVRIHGTKTATAARSVPILELTRGLLAWALQHAPRRRDGGLFRPWSNVRRDLAQACERAGMPAVTPNDLRRTLATWLREGGVDASLVATVLGHRDSRMVERVYGRLEGRALTEAIEGKAR